MMKVTTNFFSKLLAAISAILSVAAI